MEDKEYTRYEGCASAVAVIIALVVLALVCCSCKTKYITNTEYKEPQEAVDWRKVRHIVVAADAYIKHFGIDLPVRFDIVTAVGDRPPFQIEHLENAFYPPQF